MNRNKIAILFFSLMLFLGFDLLAQQSAIYRDPDLDLKEGIDLFHKEQYGAAKLRFGDYLGRTAGKEVTARSDAAFYLAMCAIRLDQNSGEALVEKFLDDYPESAKANLARFEMGKVLFQEKKFKRSLRWLQQVKPGKLDQQLATEYKFYTGYCLFDQDDYQQAQNYFGQIYNIPGTFQEASKYYYYYSLFMGKNYDKALKGFLELQNSSEFGPSVRFCIAQVYYLNGQYDEVVSMATRLIRNSKPEQQSEMARIIGDSYFRLNQYAEAIPYFEQYRESTKTMTREEHYAMGYAYHMNHQNSEAVKELELVADADDELTQSSNHLLGGILVNLNDKMRARSAFSKAAALRFDKHIQEESLFNLAKLNFDLSISGEALRSFKDFMAAFPDSRYREEASEYLVKIFMSTRNYEEALATMDEMPNKSARIKKAYQRIAYYRALELFNNLKYSESIDLFNRSNEYGTHDPQIRALSYYWQGEAWYNLKEYRRAIDSFEKFISEPAGNYLPENRRALYGIGYSWFSLEDYNKALAAFRRFVSVAGKQDKLLADAYNRMGDCFFMNRTYWQAIENYDKALGLRTEDAGYALFQKGFSYGLVQRPEQKIETLRKLTREYPKSPYCDDAVYEIGRSYIDLEQNQQAIQSFREIIEKYPNSSYVRKSYVQLGLVFFNSDRNEEALTMYKKVVSTWPDTQEGTDALIGIKNVYVDENRVDDYFAFMQSIGRTASVTASEQDSLFYIAAENLYMQGNCERAQQNFSQYISRFPQGRFVLQAHNYKADCNFRSNQTDEALTSYEYIISRGTTEFIEEALARSGEIYYQKSDFGRALILYQKLEQLAENQNNLMDARAGIMRCSQRIGDYEGVIRSARDLLAMEKVPVEMVREGSFRLGKAYFETGDQDKALEILSVVARDVKNAEGAEAKYLKADILFRKGQADQAEKEILDFLDQNTTHQFWLAKAYILWSDIYVTKGDLFQAKATLDILKESYSRQDDGIVATVDEKLRWIQNQEK